MIEIPETVSFERELNNAFFQMYMEIARVIINHQQPRTLRKFLNMFLDRDAYQLIEPSPQWTGKTWPRIYVRNSQLKKYLFWLVNENKTLGTVSRFLDWGGKIYARRGERMVACDIQFKNGDVEL